MNGHLTTARVPAATPAPAAPRAVTLAPFALVRVAALPYQALLDLAAPSATAACDRYLAAWTRMSTLQPPLEDALHRAVPSATPEDRRLLVTLKRDVHNTRHPRTAVGTLEALAARLPREDAEVLKAWLAADRASRDARADLEVSYDAGVRLHTRVRLHELVMQEDFLRPLVLASPELYRHVVAAGPARSHDPASTKAERSLLAYVLRAGAKTSPFSSFMHHALIELDPADASPLPLLSRRDRTARSYLNRGALASLGEAAAREPSLRGEPLMSNPSLSVLGDGCVELSVPTYVPFARRLWRVEQPRRLRLHPRLGEHLRALPAELPFAQLGAELAACGLAPEAAGALAEKLVLAGVASPRRTEDAFVERPGAELLGRLADARCPDAAAASAAIDALTGLADAFCQLSAEARAVALDEARRLYRIASTSLSGGRSDGAPDADALNLILEDAHLAGPCSRAGSALTALLGEVGAALAPHVVERPEFAALRNAFLARFGVGGTSDDLVGFMRAQAPVPTDPATPPAAERRPRPAAGPGLPISVFVQVATPASGPVAVINQVHSGCGVLSARYGFGEDAFPRALRAGLRRWIHAVKAPREPVDVPLCGECNPLQAHPRLTERVLVWPGEPTSDPRALLARDVVLRHDPLSDTLELLDRAGKPLAPVYLGATVLTAASGPPYWLTVLAQPYEIERPGALLMPPPDTRGDVLQVPARVHGRVVLQRATTWLRGRRICEQWLRGAGPERLLAVAADCAALGVPRIVFARPAVEAAPRGDRHKPIWVDTRNPFSLDLLGRLAATSEWVALSEPYPAPQESWPRFDDGARATELLVEMVL